MTKEEIIAWASERDWTKDKYGHLRKRVEDKSYRLKLGDKKVRYEINVGGSWVRLASAFYKDLSISEEGKLMGMKRAL